MQGTQLTATATCPIGGYLFGGGIKVILSNTNDRDKVQVVESYPSFPVVSGPALNGVWTASATASASLGGMDTFAVQAFALCST